MWMFLWRTIDSNLREFGGKGVLVADGASEGVRAGTGSFVCYSHEMNRDVFRQELAAGDFKSNT
jgi:hypothetical protein